MWFVVQGDDSFYSDHVCPFGCSSSSSNTGIISNAGVDIWTLKRVGPIVKYEDDLIASASPFSTHQKSFTLTTAPPPLIALPPSKFLGTLTRVKTSLPPSYISASSRTFRTN